MNNTIIEKRTLPVGVEFGGKVHREIEVEPRRVKHMLRATKDPAYLKDRETYEVCCLAAQTVKLGEIPKEEITGNLILEEMLERDFDVLTEAAEKARQRAEGFSAGRGTGEADNPGDAETGVQAPGNP